jgi:hypothetical protein
VRVLLIRMDRPAISTIPRINPCRIRERPTQRFFLTAK